MCDGVIASAARLKDLPQKILNLPGTIIEFVTKNIPFLPDVADFTAVINSLLADYLPEDG